MVWEDPELTSSHRHTKSTVAYGTIPSEKDLNTSWTAPSQQIKGALRQVGEAETYSWQKRHPWCSNSSLGGISQSSGVSLRSEEVMSHSRNPKPWEVHWDKPLKCLALKSNEAYVQETQRAVVYWNTTCKGLAHKLTCHSAKAAVWEVLSLLWKKIHLLILKSPPEKQGPIGTPPGTKVLTGITFAHSL